MVSQPEPVVSIYAAWLGANIVKVEEGRPLGEMLMSARGLLWDLVRRETREKEV